MIRTPSRLWRSLELTAPLIRIWSEDDAAFTLDDHHIKSIVIRRGSGGYGPQDHTIEIATTLPLGIRTGMRVHCDLSSSAAAQIALRLGGSTKTIQSRYFGRIGRHRIDDQGRQDWHATLYGSSWQAQLKNTSVEMAETYGTPVREFLQQLSAPMGVGMPWMPVTVAPAVASQYGYIAANGDPVDYSEGIRRWATDPGIYVQNCRDGHDRLLPNQYRWDQALAGMSDRPPLTRSQALSPATWEQPQEDNPGLHRVLWTGSNGPESFTRGEDPYNTNLPVTEHDLRHVIWTGNDYQPRSVARAGFYGARPNGYRIPSVTIDLLALVKSPFEYHRAQARYLLEMEMGDPVYLSGDWNMNLQGIHFATSISEEIAPNGWKITLDLSPSFEVVGEFSPPIPAQVWESMTTPWDAATGTWINP